MAISKTDLPPVEGKNAKKSSLYWILGILLFILSGYIPAYQFGAFMGRYQTDSEISDLKDKLKTQKVIIDSFISQQRSQNALKPTLPPAPPKPQLSLSKYHSSGGHFSINAPNSWTINQFGHPAEDTIHNINIEILPANEPALPSESMTIYSQDAAPGTWMQLISQFNSYTKQGWFLDIKIYNTQIAGYPAQVQRFVWKHTPPSGFAGEWTDSTEKILSINTGDNKDITVHMKWSNANPQFESYFDYIVSSLTLEGNPTQGVTNLRF